jgi:acetyltransferase
MDSSPPDREIGLREGSHFVLRGVRPDDEARLREMFAHASPEDIRHRCFGAMHDFAQEMAHRLAHLDPDAEWALAAATPAGRLPEEIFGAVHVIRCPEAVRTAEFDIMVRSDFKLHGLGYRLMTEMLREARRRGCQAVIGYILRDNYTMLQMAREHGFETDAVEGDVLRVKARLAEPPVLAEPTAGA